MSSDPYRDLVELRDLVDRYGVYVDAREFAKAGELFTDSATMTHSFSVVAIGSAEIGDSFQPGLEWFTEQHGMSLERLHTQHLVGNHVCELDGDTATGTTLCLARLCDPGAEPPLIVLNVLRYEDVYTRTADGWRFQARTNTRLWSERPELAG